MSQPYFVKRKNQQNTKISFTNHLRMICHTHGCINQSHLSPNFFLKMNHECEGGFGSVAARMRKMGLMGHHNL